MAFDATEFKVDPLALTTPRARLEYLRDFLRGLPGERFNMGSTARPASVESCGTPACIAGWSLTVFERPYEPFYNTGVALFGLSEQATGDLFFGLTRPMADGVEAAFATPADAADVLDHLIATGEVDWSVARKAEA